MSMPRKPISVVAQPPCTGRALLRHHVSGVAQQGGLAAARHADHSEDCPATVVEVVPEYTMLTTVSRYTREHPSRDLVRSPGYQLQIDEYILKPRGERTGGQPAARVHLL